MLSPLPGPAPPLPSAVLTGLVVSLPRLPLLLRLPISVWELDCDIPSKKGLWAAKQHSQGQSGAARPQNSNLWSAERAGFLERLKTRASRMSGERDTAEADGGGGWTEGLKRVLSGLLSVKRHLYPEGWRFIRGEEPRFLVMGGGEKGLGDGVASGDRGFGPHLSLGFGVLRMLSVSSISGPLSLGLYISRLSYSSSKSSSTSRICSRDTCSSPKPTYGGRQNL